MTAHVSRDSSVPPTASGIAPDASAQYLNCPRCRLSIRRRGLALHMIHCPRCVARTRTLVELFASTLPADQLYGGAATPVSDATRSRLANAPTLEIVPGDPGEER